jgi:antitoxin (DNA-binding transcriptional repressor) of toxin-antitoxin stability system
VKTVTATYLARNFSDCLGQVQFRGEAFRIRKHGRVCAVLGPEAPAECTCAEAAAAVVAAQKHLRPGDAERMAADLAAGRAALKPITSAWD